MSDTSSDSRPSSIRRSAAFQHSPAVRSPLNPAYQTQTPSRRPSGVGVGTSTVPRRSVGTPGGGRALMGGCGDGTPLRTPVSRIKGGRASEGGRASPRFVRKRPLSERMFAAPASALFHLSLLLDPSNLPPALQPIRLARPAGLALHALHFLVRIRQWSQSGTKSILRSSATLKAGGGAETRARALRLAQRRSVPWASLLIVLLFLAAIGNAYYLFSRFRTYRMFLRKDPVASPSAKLVEADVDPFPHESSKGRSEHWGWKQWLWATLVFMWKWFKLLIYRPLLSLAGFSTKPGAEDPAQASRGRVLPEGRALVQQLDVWEVNEAALALFTIYSPAHALCWQLIDASNWVGAIVLMLAISGQLHLLTTFFGNLVKDRAIIAAEVMHEYDERFVFPRVFPLKREIGVQTSQAETLTEEEWAGERW